PPFPPGLAVLLDRDRPVELDWLARLRLLLHDAAQKVGQEAAPFAEQLVDARRATPRLDLVEQRLIERGAERRRLGLADAAHDSQHLTERRQQRLEVGGLLGLAPDH